MKKRLALPTALVLASLGAAGANPNAEPNPTAPPSSDGRQWTALIEDLSHAAASAPGDASIRRRIARMLMLDGRVQEALPWLEEAHRIEPRPAREWEVAMTPAPAAQSPDLRGPAGFSDVIVGAIPDLDRHSSVSVGGQIIISYSLGTDSCNIGIGPAAPLWRSNTPEHPTIAQNMYRLKDGRFEQVGMAWVKHGFLVDAANLCGTCTDLAAFDHLPPGCSDLYSAATNATGARLGPRSGVNASTGVNIYPHPAPQGVSGIRGRLQAHATDLNNQNSDGSPARYFVEGQYVLVEDCAAETDNNNASYRQITVSGGPAYNINFAATPLGATTQTQQAAIAAWKSLDPDVVLVAVNVPGDGRFHLGCRVTDNGDGTWHYEYALHNMNSDRSGQAFSIPVPSIATVTNIGFHDVDYHSSDAGNTGEFDGADWPGMFAAGAVSWAATPFATNTLANALRFATLYNFRFDADRPPMGVNATLTLFKPGGPASVIVPTIGPRSVCLGDTDGDGVVNSSDIGNILGAWDAIAGPQDLSGDGVVNSTDISYILGTWGPCP